MTSPALAEASTEGTLELHFVRDASGTTVLTRRGQRFPLRITTPLRLDPHRPDMAFVYVQNPTGAVFAGDRLSMAIEVGDAGCLHLTTAAATKVHRMEEGHAAQDTVLMLGEGSYAESVPDLLIPQAGSRYRQRTQARLARGARLVLCESVAPGRDARGERFAYDRLELGTRIRDGDGDLVVDVLELEPRVWAPSRRGLAGRRPFMGTIHAVAPDGDADALAADLDEELGRQERALASAGTLPGGVGAFARVLAEDAPALRAAVHSGWAVARMALLGAAPPVVRK